MKLIKLACAALAAFVHLAAAAQDYPTRPVRIIVPYAAGGGVDAAARIVSQGLSAALGQPVIVESKPGGSTIIGSKYVARAAPDGYTLLLAGGSTMSLMPLTNPGKLPFNTLTDFEPIGMISRIPFFLFTGSSQPYHSLKDLMQDAKAKPGVLAYASNGVGSMGHVGTEMLLRAAGASMIHVPYEGFAPTVGDLVSGRVSMIMADKGALAGPLQAGKLRALAVASRQRSPFMPDVPTFQEAGYPNSEFEVWLALYAPAKTPHSIVDHLQAQLGRLMGTPAVRDALANLGQEADSGDGDAVQARIIAEQRAYAPIVKAANIVQRR